MLQVCPKCKEIGPFYTTRQSLAIYRVWCIPCVKKDRAEKYPRVRAARHRQYERNKTHVAAITRAYRKAHPHIYAAASAKFRAANPDKVGQTNSTWRMKNPDKVRANRKRQAPKYKAALRRASVVWADAAAVEKFYAEAARLTTETNVRHEVDHVEPLRGKLICGLHCEFNLRVVPRSINRRKSNKSTAT